MKIYSRHLTEFCALNSLAMQFPGCDPLELFREYVMALGLQARWEYGERLLFEGSSEDLVQVFQLLYPKTQHMHVEHIGNIRGQRCDRVHEIMRILTHSDHKLKSSFAVTLVDQEAFVVFKDPEDAVIIKLTMP